MTLRTKPSAGLYRKYLVKRLRDREKKHAWCEYFVLDLHHDAFAAPALNAYAEACEATLPGLAGDLRSKVAEIHGRMAARAEADSRRATPKKSEGGQP